MKKEEIQKRVQEHYDEACSLGKEIFAVFLQGSQNYGLDVYDENYKSDVDTKAICLPSLDDIVRGKQPYSSTHVRKNNEHIDIKDIRCMVNMWKKQNIAYIEILFTGYVVVNPKYKNIYDKLISKRNEIATLDKKKFLGCLVGMIQEKLNALCHPYPTIIDKINKYGYDPKQLHHIIRIDELMKRYLNGESLDTALKTQQREYLLNIKINGVGDVQIAKQMAEKYSKEDYEVYKKYKSENDDYVNQDTIDFLDEISAELIKRYLKEELKEDK